jgi:hypothetical protein
MELFSFIEAYIRETRNVYTVLVEAPKDNAPLGSHTRRWKVNIKMYLRIRECGLDSSGSGQKPVEGSYEYGNESSGYIKDGEFLE